MNHVTYFEISAPTAGQAAALAGFYRDALGVDSAPHPADPDFHAILPAAGEGTPGFVLGGGAGFDVTTYAVVYVQVADVDAAVRAVEATGGAVLTPPHQHGPVRAAHIADPFGNRIGLFTGDAS